MARATLFDEQTPLWRNPLYAAVGIVVVVGVSAVAFTDFDPALMVVGPGFLALVAAWLWFGGVHIKVRYDRLTLRAGRWPASRIAISDIESVRPQGRRVYFGSVHWRVGGMVPVMPRTFTMWGSQIVQIRRRDGSEYLVGPQDEQGFLAAVETALAMRADASLK